MSSRCRSIAPLILCVLFAGAACGRAAATTLYVSEHPAHPAPSQGADAGKRDGRSWATAYPRLSTALGAARPGDEVWVVAGQYSGRFILRAGIRLYGGFHGNETRREERDWQRYGTILNGNGEGPVVTLEGSATSYRTVLDGFTIKNGRGRLENGRRIGGGVLVSGPVRAVVAHNDIRDNTVRAEAGARVADGGGIGLVEGATAIIKDNLIRANVAGFRGGGIAVWDASDAQIANNTVVQNTAPQGGGMAFLTSKISLLNNLVAYNSSGLYYDQAGGDSPDGPAVRHHLLYENGSYQYQGWTQALEDEGSNVWNSPAFVDMAHGTFRLAKNSPARDAGLDAAVGAGDEDFYGQSRIIWGRVDIGASEGRPTGYVEQLPMGGERRRDFPLDMPVVCVDPTNPRADDMNPGATWNLPKKSIMAGIDAAKRQGGEVRVVADTFTEKIFLPGGVSLRGGYVANARGDMKPGGLTAIAANAEGREATAMIAAGSVLEGFSFTGGPAVACGEGVSTVRSCAIGHSRTAGVISDGGSPRLLGCTFRANQPAVRLMGGSSEVRSCRFIGNAGEDEAGGVVLSHGSAVIVNNLFAGNVGGAVSVFEAMANVVNNTFYGNHGYPYYVGRLGDVGARAGAVDSTRSALTFANNIVARNTGGVQDRYSLAGYPVLSHNCVDRNEGFDWQLERLADPSGARGNFRADPMLAAPETGNFHLLPASPCRNAGDATLWIGEEGDSGSRQRIAENAMDIGSVESGAALTSRRVAIVYVAPGGSDAASGESWQTALRSLPEAVRRIPSGGEVWVAAGQYRATVVLPGFVALYGGFSGRETRREQRNPAKNVTELLGSNQDTPVVVQEGAAFSVVDGFTIRNGRPSGYSIAAAAGVACHRGSTCRIENCVLQENQGEQAHAVGADHAWVSLANSTLTKNGDDGKGPDACVLFNHSLGRICDNVIEANAATGIRLLDRSAPLVRGNRITANAGDAGGLSSHESFGEIANNTISGNMATRLGGGLSLDVSTEYIHDNVITGNTTEAAGGGILTTAGNPLLVNNTVTGNTAGTDGGAAFIETAAMLYNNILAFNSSGVAGSNILHGEDRPTLAMRWNCLFGNAGYDTRDLPETGFVGDNLFVNPLFEQRTGARFRLSPRSPCLDRGTDSFLAETDRDIDGEPRLMGEAVDIGADERTAPSGTPGGTRVLRARRPGLPPLRPGASRPGGGPM